MPNKKTISVFIVCLGIVLSVWLVSDKKNHPSETGGVFGSTEETKVYTADDWKKILVTLDGESASLLNPEGTSTYPNEGTQTDLLSKDLLAQYLILKQGGTEITSEQAIQIAQNTLSFSEYTKGTGVEYTKNDLKINPKTNKEIVQNYINTINQSLVNRSPKNLENELAILNRAVNLNQEEELSRLDPIIAGYKGLIGDFLQISVPSDAVSIHLNLLNSMSDVLSNIEGMRQTFSDPLRGFVATSQYKKHALDLSLAMKNLEEYSLSKR